jgi:hypothetical protein
MYALRRLFNPEMFQGGGRKKHYFEGWYFRISDEPGENSLALIPGVSLGESFEDSHAFIQVMNETNRSTHYFTFDLKEFSYSRSGFSISIGENTFDRESLSVDLAESGFSIKGKLTFRKNVPFPKTLLSPGIMGPFSFIPFMECSHGVVSISNRIEGRMEIGGREIDFTGGRGYIEKDWGKSFPEWWVWIHSDRFEEEDAVFLFSAARIPWLGMHFTGFLSFLKVGDEIFRFATYTGARIRKLEHSGGELRIELRDRRHSLEIRGVCIEGRTLKAPKGGRMLRDISESMSSDLKVTLKRRDGRTVFEGRSRNAGMELET